MEEEKKPAEQPARAPFLGASMMRTAHLRYKAWERTEEGKEYMKDHMSPEAYEQMLREIKEREEGNPE